MVSKQLRGVCPKSLSYDVDADLLLHNVAFVGGCHGNLQAIAKLVEGRPVNEIIELLGGIKCGSKSTSCADQLAKALSDTSP